MCRYIHTLPLHTGYYPFCFVLLLHQNYSLVLTSRRLACLELVKVPSTDSQAALVLVHALAEALDVVCAGTRLCHLSGCLVLCGEVGILGRGVGRGGRTTAEETANCVAD